MNAQQRTAWKLVRKDGNKFFSVASASNVSREYEIDRAYTYDTPSLFFSTLADAILFSWQLGLRSNHALILKCKITPDRYVHWLPLHTENFVNFWGAFYAKDNIDDFSLVRAPYGTIPSREFHVQSIGIPGIEGMHLINLSLRILQEYNTGHHDDPVYPMMTRDKIIYSPGELMLYADSIRNQHADYPLKLMAVDYAISVIRELHRFISKGP